MVARVLAVERCDEFSSVRSAKDKTGSAGITNINSELFGI
jgi:hypothetical protein